MSLSIGVYVSLDRCLCLSGSVFMSLWTYRSVFDPTIESEPDLTAGRSGRGYASFSGHTDRCLVVRRCLCLSGSVFMSLWTHRSVFGWPPVFMSLWIGVYVSLDIPIGV